MWQQFTDQLPQGFSLLGDGMGFYFGSAVLVLLALIPTAGRIAGVLSGQHILKLPVNFLLECIVLAGRIAFIAAIFVVGNTMDTTGLTRPDSWLYLGQDIALLLSVEWAGFAAKLLVAAVVLLAIQGAMTYLVTEQRTAKVLERMQNKATPGTVERIIELTIQNMVIVPLFLVCIFLALQLVEVG